MREHLLDHVGSGIRRRLASKVHRLVSLVHAANEGVDLSLNRAYLVVDSRDHLVKLEVQRVSTDKAKVGLVHEVSNYMLQRAHLSANCV